MGRRSLVAVATVLTAMIFFAPSSVRASGFYVTDRGVRPLGRAGAYVAGADDAHSIWYNPAGLSWGQPGVLLDGSLLFFGNTFQRQAQFTYPDGTSSGAINYPSVHGSAAPFPVPTLVVMHDFGLRGWMFAFGVFAPNAVITSYPSDTTAPQRYSLITLDGSLLANAGVWASYRRGNFSVGVGIQALLGSFISRIALSGCPATITCQPEDPDWDALAQLRVGPIFAPTANAGVRWQPSPYVVLGISGQLPTWVSAPATLNVRLPSEPYYNGASISGNQGNVAFTLAPILRAGIEVRPVRQARVELAFVWEGWSMHDQIAITPSVNGSQPNGIQIVDVRGLATYQVGTVTIQRHFQDSYSVRLGAEYDQPLGTEWHFFPRVGVSYETSATPTPYTNVLTFDADKVLSTLGVGFSYHHFRFDAVYAHMFANSVKLDPRDAMLYPTAPFRQGSMAPMNAINAGRYDLSVDVVGLGAQYTF